MVGTRRKLYSVTPSPRRTRGRTRRRQYTRIRRTRRTRRGRSLLDKKINRAIAKSQEQKQITGIISVINSGNVNAFGKIMFGTNLFKGDGVNQRVGDSVYLKGMRIDMKWEHKGAQEEKDMYVHLYVCTLKNRTETLANTWWYNDTGQRLDYPAISTKDAMVQRKNLADMTIHWGKKIKLRSPRIGVSSDRPFSYYGSQYIKIGKHIKWNTTETPTGNFAEAVIAPAVYVAMYVLAPDDSRAAISALNVENKVTYYYRE